MKIIESLQKFLLDLSKLNFKLYIVTLSNTQRRGGGTGRADKGEINLHCFAFALLLLALVNIFNYEAYPMGSTHISHELKSYPGMLLKAESKLKFIYLLFSIISDPSQLSCINKCFIVLSQKLLHNNLSCGVQS